MARDRRTRKTSPEADELEYVLFIHGKPPAARWQELKDLAREYGTAHYRKADTIEPTHETGYILIAGIKNAKHAFHQFSQRGWQGKSILVTLNGPVDRVRFDLAKLDNRTILAGPVRSPASDSHGAHQRDLGGAEAAFGRRQQSRAAPIPVSRGSHRTPPRPYITAPVSVPIYDRSSTYSGSSIPPGNHTSLLPHPATPTSAAPAPPTRAPYANSRVTAAAAPINPVAPRPQTRPSRPHTVPSQCLGSIYKSIKVLNLPFEFKKAAAQRLFENFGSINRSSIQLQHDNQGRITSSTAYARYVTAESAERAIRELDNTEIGHRTLYAVYTSYFDSDSETSSGLHHSTASRSGKRGQGTSAAGGGSGSGSTRNRERRSPRDRDKDRSKQQDRSRQHARGPLVVDGARGNARRRREVESKTGDSSDDDDSNTDSERSDVEREARRRGSSGSAGSGGTRFSEDSGNIAGGVRLR